jgi:DNA (cytosine-5)-methyltransferase 1
MEVLGSIYTEVSDRFQKGIIEGGISRCVKAEKHDLGVIMTEIQEKRLGNIYSFDGGNYARNVYDKECISPTLKTMQGGNSQPMVVTMRGRNPDNPSDRTVGSPTEQRLEANMQGTSNCLTSVQKDNLLLEKPQYRIRKLTPRECGRLMGVSDEDIDKMAAVNSNTQLYKQFGNSIVVDVMCAMFKNLNIKQGDTV